MRVPSDGFGQLTPFFVTNVTWWGTNQTASGKSIHVFTHVDSNHIFFVPIICIRKGFTEFGLSNSGRTTEQKTGNWSLSISHTTSCSANGLGNRSDGWTLTLYSLFEFLFEILQPLLLAGIEFANGDSRNIGNDSLNRVFCYIKGLTVFRHFNHRSSFINHINCLVGQESVVDVSVRQFCCRYKAVVSIFNTMELLVFGRNRSQDVERLINRRLFHVQRLKSSFEGAILFNVLSVFGRSGSSHHSKFTSS
mmetsp:Transcript_8090/g.17430  ORF Transcript_8090/g.17430 Transcript_8090/m.17430 type:complete len:250 (+) Transcript_8090:904-1653(+)